MYRQVHTKDAKEQDDMNTGKIQEIFDQHKETRQKEFVPVTHYGLDTLFETLEQQLIEAIQKELDKSEYEDQDGIWSIQEDEYQARQKVKEYLIGQDL